MKKLSLLFALLLALLCFTACGTDAPEETLPEETASPAGEDNINPDSILLSSVEGLNEQIWLNVTKPENGDITVYYKAKDASEYTLLDRELMLEYRGVYDCYILGLPKGLYDVRIEQGEGDTFARKTITDIDVEKQDRSGYAHFNREEGIGGYNNDGSVKENAKILYLTNENKNTVSLEIGGTTYTGLVAILQANQYMEEPLIIRVLDKITTNQWKTRKSEPRRVDNPIPFEEYFNNTLNDSGENLAGIPIKIYDRQDEKCHEYITTPDGFEYIQTVDYPGATTYSETLGTDVYVDAVDLNYFTIDKAKHITIEGVGKKAGFHQFGFAFYVSDSIEIKNLTIEKFPVDGIGFHSNAEELQHGGYWIHHNTFKRGYNTWIFEAKSGNSGDEAIDMADVHSVTVAYNTFNGVDKVMLIGGWKYDTSLNISIHHNSFAGVDQRTPLSQNANVHNYNNLYLNCANCFSPRTNSYLFNEANHYENCSTVFYHYSGEDETPGYAKSYGEVFLDCGKTERAIVVEDREAYVENTCKPDWVTDYSRFDTDPTLFYYDAVNKCSDVDILLPAEKVPEFVKTYAGAGILVKLDIPSES